MPLHTVGLVWATLIALWFMSVGVAWGGVGPGQPDSVYWDRDDLARLTDPYLSPTAATAHHQSWRIVASPDGQIYVANGKGLLRYDGVAFQHLVLPQGWAVRDLHVVPDGRVFVATAGDFGVFEPQGAGHYRYASLLPQELTGVQGPEVRRVVAVGDALYFAARRHLFRWHPADGVHHRPVPGGIRALDAVRGRLVLQRVGQAPETVGEDLTTIEDPWAEVFGTQRVHVVRGDDQGTLIVDGRVWQSSPGGLRPLTQDRPLAHVVVTSARRTRLGTLLVGTHDHGLLVLGERGRVVNVIGNSDPLPGRWVTDIAEDGSGQIWLSFGDEGIARLDIASGLTRFGRQAGLRAVEAIVRFGDELLVGTHFGLFRLVDEHTTDAHFEALFSDRIARVWSLMVDGDRLLVGTDSDVLEVVGNAVRTVYDGQSRVTSLTRLVTDPDQVVATLGDGVALLTFDGVWRSAGRHAEIGQATQFSGQHADGALWLGTLAGQYLRVTGLDAWPRSPVESYGSDDGVPKGWAHLFRVDGELRFGTYCGMHVLDDGPDGRRFVRDERFGPLSTDDYGIKRVSNGVDGRHWYTVGWQVGVFRAHGDGWDVETTLPELSAMRVFSIHQDQDGVVWFGGTRGVARLDPALRQEPAPAGAVRIRDVIDREVNEIVAAPLRHEEAFDLGALGVGPRSLRFRYGATDRTMSPDLRFRARLTGVDEQWSEWSREIQRDFTGLRHGVYTFEVEGTDSLDRALAPAAVTFSIAPRWFERWTVWIGAGLLLAWGLGVGVRQWVAWRTSSAVAEALRLEGLVTERTLALAAANQQLLRQSHTDPLTGLDNRRSLVPFVEEAHGEPLCIVLIDVDHFKRINDTRGHSAGDEVLKELASRLQAAAGPTDLCVRWGGEELLWVRRGHHGVQRAAEQFSRRVAAHPFPVAQGEPVHCTVSIGWALHPLRAVDTGAAGVERAVRLADAAMYLAKQEGRNTWRGVSPGPRGVHADDGPRWRASTLHEAEERGWVRVHGPADRPRGET